MMHCRNPVYYDTLITMRSEKDVDTIKTMYIWDLYSQCKEDIELNKIMEKFASRQSKSLKKQILELSV